MQLAPLQPIIKIKDNSMKFKIITNKQTADEVRKTFDWDNKFDRNRSIKLESITHEHGYSTIIISSRDGELINPSDIFFLGLFTGLNSKS